MHAHTHTHTHTHYTNTHTQLCICCNSTLSYTSPTSAWCLTHTDYHSCTPLLPWQPTTQHWFGGSKAVRGGLYSQANGHPLYHVTSLIYTTHALLVTTRTCHLSCNPRPYSALNANIRSTEKCHVLHSPSPLYKHAL